MPTTLSSISTITTASGNTKFLELNKDTVQPGLRFVIAESHRRLAESVDTRRKNISVFNHVERLNKHPSLFINYLRQVAANKGISFNIDEGLLDKDATKAKDPRTNYRLQSIIQAQDITYNQY